jgi:hypothetical protein
MRGEIPPNGVPDAKIRVLCQQVEHGIVLWHMSVRIILDDADAE